MRVQNTEDGEEEDKQKPLPLLLSMKALQAAWQAAAPSTAQSRARDLADALRAALQPGITCLYIPWTANQIGPKPAQRLAQHTSITVWPPGACLQFLGTLLLPEHTLHADTLSAACLMSSCVSAPLPDQLHGLLGKQPGTMLPFEGMHCYVTCNHDHMQSAIQMHPASLAAHFMLQSCVMPGRSWHLWLC